MRILNAGMPSENATLLKNVCAPPLLYRRTLKLIAKFESGSSQFSFKR